MDVPIMTATANVLADIKTNFIDTYSYAPSDLLKGVLDCVNKYSMEHRQDRFMYYKSLPLASRIEYGEEFSYGESTQESYLIKAYRYGNAIRFLEDDVRDDLTKSLANRARKLGEGLKILPQRIFFQLLTDRSDVDLLGASTALPDAPDGLALYSSSTRLGSSSGNIVSGSGITGSAVGTDFYSVMTRFSKFLHTDGTAGYGTPLISPEDMREVIIFHPTDMLKAFADAFVRTQVANGSSVFEGSNVIRESGFTVKTYATSYLTDANDWYVFLPKLEVLPIVFGQRDGLITKEFNSANSSELNRKGQSEFTAHERQGWSVNLPMGTIKVSQA